MSVVCQLPQDVPPPPPPPDRLKELLGRWEVLSESSTSEQTTIPAELLGLTKKGTQVVIKGNELTDAEGKLLATLTTDLTDLRLDLDKSVFYRRRPILITLPSGKGLLCAYDIKFEILTFFYPHRMGRVDQGTWLSFSKPKD